MEKYHRRCYIKLINYSQIGKMNKYLELLVANNKDFIEKIAEIAISTKEKIENSCIENSTPLTIDVIQESEYEFAAILAKETAEYNLKNNSNLRSNIKYSEMFNNKSICFLFDFTLDNNIEGININIMVTNSVVSKMLSIIKGSDVYTVLSVEFFNQADKRECLRIEERKIINCKMKDSNFLSFKLGKKINGNGVFRSYCLEKDMLEKHGITKELQTAMSHNPEIFSDYLYLNKDITKEQIEMFYLTCDIKVEINDLELNRYKRNIDEINLDKNYNLNKNTTLSLK